MVDLKLTSKFAGFCFEAVNTGMVLIFFCFIGSIYGRSFKILSGDFMLIGKRIVEYGIPPLLIAEIGINHNGSLQTAFDLIDGAKAAGCDMVKFQKRTVDVVYTPEELAKPRDNPFGSTNGDLKRGLEFGKKQFDAIDDYCRAKKIMWFASPWDEASVDFLEQYDPPCYKIASACNRDAGLVAHIMSKGRPIIVSIGMSDDDDVSRIVEFLGERDLVVLHCTATYPAKDSELNLANIPRLIGQYSKAYIGYSGHEVGLYSSLVAATLGACVIERHITLDRSMWGSDQAASLEVVGFMKLAKQLRVLPVQMGNPTKELLESERPVEAKLRRVDTL